MTTQRRFVPVPVVAHADWSKDPRKRFVAVARWTGTHYEASAPVPAWDTSAFFDRLPGGALAGFDFPIGLPSVYAARAGITNFRNALPFFSGDFYTVAEQPEQISLRRPFYPRVPGNTSVSQLLRGLGMTRQRELLRECDAAAGGAPLFWTLGARQPGRAAIAGWRELLGPALRDGAIALWPFDGTLEELVGAGKIVVVEAYPAEAYGRIGIPQPIGKQEQWKRTAAGVAMTDWADYYGVSLLPDLRDQIADGFGSDAQGEDRFDAVAGLLGMLDVVLGNTPHVEPSSPRVRSIEGWIIGLRYASAEQTGSGAAQARTTAG